MAHESFAGHIWESFPAAGIREHCTLSNSVPLTLRSGCQSSELRQRGLFEC